MESIAAFASLARGCCGLFRYWGTSDGDLGVYERLDNGTLDRLSVNERSNRAWGKVILKIAAYAAAIGAPVAVRVLNFHPISNTLSCVAAGFLPAAVASWGATSQKLVQLSKAFFPYAASLIILFSDLWASTTDPTAQQIYLSILFATGGLLIQQTLAILKKKGFPKLESTSNLNEIERGKTLAKPDSTLLKGAQLASCAALSVLFGIMSWKNPASLFGSLYPALSTHFGCQLIARLGMTFLDRRIEQSEAEGTCWYTVRERILSAAYFFSLIGYVVFPLPGLSKKVANATKTMQVCILSGTLGFGQGLRTSGMDHVLATTPEDDLEILTDTDKESFRGFTGLKKKIYLTARKAAKLFSVACLLGVFAWQEATLGNEKSRIVYSGFLLGGLASYSLRGLAEKVLKIDSAHSYLKKFAEWFMCHGSFLINPRDVFIIFVSSTRMDSSAVNQVKGASYLIAFWVAWFAYGFRAFYEVTAHTSSRYGMPLEDKTQALFASIRTILRIFLEQALGKRA